MSTPMTADQWLNALHAEGVETAIPYAGWSTYGRDGATGKPFGPVKGVVIHHTAGSNSLAVVHDGRSDLPGPLCHGHLPKTGVVNMISRLRANHAGTFAQNAVDAMIAESSAHPVPDAVEPVDANDITYGLEIENLGNGSDPYPDVQYIAAVKWATAICRFHGWGPDSVIGHKEGTRRKTDPSFSMATFRTDVRSALDLPAGVWGTEGEDVALTAAEITAVADAVLAKLTADAAGKKAVLAGLTGTDNVLRSPLYDQDPNGDLYWSWGSYIRGEYIKVERTEGKVDALADQLSALASKVDSIAVAGVDLDTLAVKVADEIYKRMAG